jgi:hypothetical protein
MLTAIHGIACVMRCMDVDGLNPFDLRRCLLPAFNLVEMHRIARDHCYDLAKITAERDVVEQRVLHILSETDATQMPNGWSWTKAAEQLACLMVLDMIDQQEQADQ